MNPSSSRQLNISNLQELDRGKVAVAVSQALRQCTQDIQDRPGDKSARKVVLVVSQRPVLDKNTSALDVIAVDFKVRVAIPDRQSLAYPMLPTPEGTLNFQPGSPLDPRQATFDYAAPVSSPIQADTPDDDMSPETGPM